jgi:ATP-dependent RNA helicase DHX8/PRP22
VLNLKAMGINDLIGFDFLDPPSPQTLVTAMHQLYTLGALDDEGLLTRVGRKMAEFPIEPPLSKMLICSAELGCADEILTIVAMLSVENVFYRPKEKQVESDQAKAKFNQAEGDHITLLVVYQEWAKSAYSSPWCHERFIQSRTMKKAQDVRKQMLAIMDRYKLDIISAGNDMNLVRKAVVSGFFSHAAKKDPAEGYKTLSEGTTVYVHPSSALFQKNPDWVIYHELVLTTKEYMRQVMLIEPKWLVELAPNFFRRGDPNKPSSKRYQEKLQPLYDYRMAADPVAWRLSKRKG